MINHFASSQLRTSLPPLLRQSYQSPCNHFAKLSTPASLRTSTRLSLLKPALRPASCNDLPPRCQIPFRQYYQHHNPYSTPHASSYIFNRRITRICIGTAIVVYGAWDFSNRGIIYSAAQKQCELLRSFGLNLPRELHTQPVYDLLTKYFMLHANNPHNYPSWLGAAFSHQNLLHIFFNMMVWSSFAPLLYTLPRTHFLAIIFGSALASSGAFMIDHDRKGDMAKGLGSSGITSGILATATMFAPMMPASIFVVSAPLWVITGGYFLIDAYFMSSERSAIGHSAHIGGSLFGVLYYAIFLRKFGGILGRRRF